MVQKTPHAPLSASIKIIGWSMLVTHLLFLWLSTRASFFPGYDALMGIVGTMAEIIAGLYGITMASYTFFLSRIDGLSAQDTTLDYIVASLKRRFKLLIWFITANVLLVLLISLTLMYLPEPSQPDHLFLYRLFCNEFLLSLGYAIGLILYYSILVIDPNSLQKEARTLRTRLSPGTDGDPAEFLLLYGHIVRACRARIPEAALHQLQENKGCRFEHTLALLPRTAPELRPLFPALRRVHRYYVCTVNCAKLQVSSQMCAQARQLLEHLEP